MRQMREKPMTMEVAMQTEGRGLDAKISTADRADAPDSTSMQAVRSMKFRTQHEGAEVAMTMAAGTSQLRAEESVLSMAGQQ